MVTKAVGTGDLEDSTSLSTDSGSGNDGKVCTVARSSNLYPYARILYALLCLFTAR